jgi:hypothetical protein
VPTSLQTPQTLPVTGYSVASTLGPFQNLEKVVFQITGGVVIFQVGRLDGSGYPNFDQTEAALPPGIWGFDKIYGIRFRSRDTGSLATIDPCTGYFDDDPDPYNPGTIPGSTTAVTGSVNFQHNEALVASQPTADFDDSALGSFVWTLTNDGPNTRVKIQPPDVVTSAFGRIGAVTAQSGDYVAAQVTNAADKASAAVQVFSAAVSTGPLTNGRATVGCFLDPVARFLATVNTITNAVFGAAVISDTAWRISFDLNGANNQPQLAFGTGSAVGDCNLTRQVTNPTPAHFNSNVSFALAGSVYPALLTVTPTPTTTVTPDYDSQTSYIIAMGGTGGGTLTIANPSNPPSATQTGYLYMQISNAPGNTATALSFGGNYSFLAVGGAPANVAQAGFWRLFFVWNGSAWLCLVKANA